MSSTIVTSGKLIWFPAQQSRSRVGQAVLSNGTRLSPIDWRANRLVDVLAKRAAAFHQLTTDAANTLAHAASLSQWALAQLARVTHSANNHETVLVDEQGVSHTKVTRDSMDRPKFAKATFSRKRAAPKPQDNPRDISAIAPWMPEPMLDGRARATKVRRCAALQRTKVVESQVTDAMIRIADELKQSSTFAESDAKRARLLERVRAVQNCGPSSA